MRGIVWAVSDQQSECVLTGRPVLEAMGVNTRALLEAFGDELNGVVNVPELLKTSSMPTNVLKDCTISRLMHQSSVYHRHCVAEEAFLEESDIYINMGENTEENLTNHWKKRK